MENLYKTKDIFEASYLYSQNLQFKGLEPDGRYSYFIFSDVEKCTALSQLYWTGQAVGNVKAFVNGFKTMKDLIFAQKKEAELCPHGVYINNCKTCQGGMYA